MEAVFEPIRTDGGVPLFWYENFGLAPGIGQTWSELDAADSDSDGFTNLQEYVAGTNPVDSASAFRITGITINASDVLTLKWTGNSGSEAVRYEVQYSGNPKEGPWVKITEINPDSQVHEWSGPMPDVAGETSVFFRVVATQPPAP